MKKIVFLIIISTSIYNYSFAQNEIYQRDSIQITLSFKNNQLVHYNIPNFKNEIFSFAYKLTDDTLRINIFPIFDTLYVKNDKYAFFDNDYLKSKIQIIKIPADYYIDVRVLIFESKYMETYFFVKKRKHENYFILKCVY